MSTVAFPALLGIQGSSALRLIAAGAIRAPAAFARAQVTSRATAIGPDDATLQIFSADTPRFTGSARRLITEGQRTNEISDPVAFGAGSGWSAVNGGTGSAPVVTANYGSIAAPDGSFTATRLQLDKGAGTAGTDQSGLSRSTSTTAARYVWARTLTGTANVQIGTSATTAGLQSTVDTTWRRLGVSDGTGVHRIMLMGGGTGNSASADLLVWGASSEAGAGFPSTLILPPAGSPQSSTRGAELVNVVLSAMGIGDNAACTVFWSGLFPQQTVGVTTLLLQIDNGTNALRWYIDSRAADGLPRIANSAGGVANLSAHTAGVPFRLGLSLDGAGRGAVSMNGNAAVALTGGPASGLTMLRLGSGATGVSNVFAETTTLQVAPYAMSDSALASAVAALPA